MAMFDPQLASRPSMSNLFSILNPDQTRKRSVKLVIGTEPDDAASSPPNSPSEIQSLSNATDDSEPQKTPVLAGKSKTEFYNHEFHPDCPDTLACLPDTDGRPQHTLPVILRCAILGSPRKRLTIREIYAAMEAKYPYYRTAGPTWKQSVRHHLSLNRLFERQTRPVTDPGFGSYWTVNLAAPPGTKRPRKRGRAVKDDLPGDQPPAPAKKRGRPRKAVSPAAFFREPTPFSSLPDDDNEEEEEKYSMQDDENISEDGYESEEELVRPHDRRHSLSGLTPYISGPSQAFSLPPFSSLEKGPDSLVDRMQSEIASLRRQSAEAVSVSLRLSEQLSQAQQESSRSRAALREVEDLLEKEARKRRDAERMASEEAKRRRTAEEALSDMITSTAMTRR